MEDAASLAQLIEALRPWLGHLVIVGGWAHRLHRVHPLAGTPAYPPIRTRDVDLAVALHAPLKGDVAAALERAGFQRAFPGDDTPPVTHYHLEDVRYRCTINADHATEDGVRHRCLAHHEVRRFARFG